MPIGVSMNHWILAILLMSSLFGCRFTDGLDEPSKAPAPEFEYGSDFSENLPPSLWSPAKRRFNAQYYFLVAEYEMMQRHTKVAQQLYEAAYGLDPDPLIGKKAVAALAVNGSYDEALIQAKRLALIHPQNAEIHSVFGRLLLEQKLLDQASEQFNKAIDLDPELIEAYLGLIGVYRIRDDLAGAAKVNLRLVQKHPRFADGWSLLAKMYLSMGKWQQAEGASDKAIKLNPGNAEKVFIANLVSSLLGKRKKADDYLAKLLHLVRTNEELVKRSESVFRQIGETNQIMGVLERESLRNNPFNFSARLLLILGNWHLGRMNEVVTDLANLAKEQRFQDRTLYLLGLAQEQSGQWEEALASFKSVSIESGFFAHARFRMMNVLRSRGMPQEAIAVVHEVAQTNPDDSADFYILGAQILAAEKKYQEVVKLLMAGITVHQQNVAMNYYLGVYLEKVNRINDSIVQMRKVIALDDKHHGALNFLGYVYAELGENLAEAEALILRALVEKPHEGSYKDSLGWVYFKMEDYDRAEKLLLEAHQLSPQEGVIAEHLGDLAYEKDEIANAITYYKKALELRLSEDDKVRIGNKIKELGAAHG